jgi:two-component system cell cycle sensor histidine kinase/response regulator CckA
MFERIQNWFAHHRLWLNGLLVLLCALPLILFLFTAHIVLSNFTSKQATQTADQLTNIAHRQLAEHFAASIQSGEAATHSMKSAALSDRDVIRKELRGVCQSVSQVAFCGFHEPKGTAILIEPEIHEDLKAFTIHPSTDAYVSPLVDLPSSASGSIAVVLPILQSGRAQPAGFVSLWFRRATVASWMQPPSLTATKYLLLVDQDFHSVAEGTVSAVPGTTDLSAYEPVRLALQGQSGSGTFRRRNQRFLVVYYPVAVAHWGLLLELPIDEVRQALWQAEKPVAVLGGGFLIIAIGFGAIAGFLYLKMQRHEHRLRQDVKIAAAARYQHLFDANPTPMWTYDLESLRFLDVNEAAISHYGYTRNEFLAQTIKDISRPEDVPALLKRLQRGESAGDAQGVWKHRIKDGSLIDVELRQRLLDLDGRRIGLISANDVTERLVLEQQLRQSQKFEAIGSLAGGIAHDFNNLLNVIGGYSELILTRVAANDFVHPMATQISSSVDRAASLTRQLLAFSRKQVLEPDILSLNDICRDVGQMLQRLIGENIELITNYEPGLWPMKADRSQLEQVLLNLAVNARDAMPAGGRLIIETANVELDEDYERRHASHRAGSYVLLTVSDTGEGMTPEVQSHIFEPFFTTKERDKGTGLGLATVYGIVKQSGGFIYVYSEPGHGSTFKVYLPRVEGPLTAKQPSSPATMAKGSETILLVEDQADLRAVARTILESAGYTVLEAATRAEARAVAESPGRAIHLLITDMVLTDGNGRDVARQVVDSHPNIRVLYVSGYADDVVIRGIPEQGFHFLQKPFSLRALLTKVRTILDTPVSTY